jgi:hypothetical protein
MPPRFAQGASAGPPVEPGDDGASLGRGRDGASLGRGRVETWALRCCVMGFSTTLVLGMMDRFVSVIRTSFGMTAK